MAFYDPLDDFQDVFMKSTKTLLVPTTTSDPSATGFPTVIPDLPKWEVAHEEGRRTLWVVFVVMVIASISFVAMAWPIPVSKRLFHIITTTITIVAALSYFAMATGMGITYHHIRIREHHNHGVPDTIRHVFRQVFYARYIDWVLTTPLLLLDLSLLANLNGANTLIAVIADVIMILTGMFAAFGGERRGSKWGWYTIACLAYLVILWQIIINGRTAARTRGAKVSTFFTSIAAFSLVVWAAYPVIWALAEGKRILSVDGEIIAYAVLDILAKPIFGLWLLLMHARLPESVVTLDGFWAHGLSSEGRIRVGDDDEGA